MTHIFRHPKHYKEMRKLQASDKPYQINYDDFCKGDEDPSSKLQASSSGGPAHNQAPDVKKKNKKK
jgi:hypothetical protein